VRQAQTPTEFESWKFASWFRITPAAQGGTLFDALRGKVGAIPLRLDLRGFPKSHFVMEGTPAGGAPAIWQDSDEGE